MLDVDLFITAIVKEEWENGGKIPSENELAKKYRVPRVYVRKALKTLDDMGYTYSVQGKGRYLQKKKSKITLPLTGSESFTQKMKNEKLHLKTKLLTFEKVKSNQYPFIKKLNEEYVWKVERLRVVEGEPLALHTSYVSYQLFPQLDQEVEQLTSMFAYYQSKGMKQFKSSESVLSTSFPTTEEKSTLQCASLTPLIIVSSNCINAETNEWLEVTKIVYRSDCFLFNIQT